MEFNDEVQFSGFESESPTGFSSYIPPYRVLRAPKAVLVILLPMSQDPCQLNTP